MDKKIKNILLKCILVIYALTLILPLIGLIITDIKMLLAFLLNALFIFLSIISYKSYIECKGKIRVTREISLMIFCNLAIVFTCIKVISYILEK